MRKILSIGLMAAALSLGLGAQAGAETETVPQTSGSVSQSALASSGASMGDSVTINADDFSAAACSGLPNLYTEGGHSTVVRCSSGYHGNVYDDAADGNCIFMKGQWFNSAGTRIKVQYSSDACPKGDVDYWQFNHPSGWATFKLSIHHD
jgi:hypothetical protein